ncbi:MAG: FHA domain-containing protein, partial [Acidobacteria bacterium]|nr:FHA domain-containing protein [Acidobacteriota bacterium]NIQ86853.1 FHA domain-containing protein [Acidobacteriota bacterium]
AACPVGDLDDNGTAMAFLLVVGGPNEGDFHPLPKETVSVGRDEACTVQIVDEAVSRHHLKIRFDAAAWLASDDDSANG